MGYCRDCAFLEIRAIKKSIALRFLAGFLLIAFVSMVSSYARQNAVEADYGNMSIPLTGAYVTINGTAFRQMFEPAEATIRLRTFILFIAPFGGRIRRADEKYRSHIAEAQVNAVGIERSFVMGSAHSQESAGMLFFEAIIAVISGPFFFFYRPIRIIKLRKYIRSIEG